jgi:Skp family chaperone for outer membrane proteins
MYAGATDQSAKRQCEPSQPDVAILDVSRLFKAYEPFTRRMDELRDSVKRAEMQITTERAEIARLTRQLEELEPGDPASTELERHVAERTSKLSADLAIQKKEFLRREARIFNEVYDATHQEVADYCREHRIRLVLRFGGEPVNPDKPQDVSRRINKRVVWAEEELDITDAILNRLKARSQQASPPAEKDPSKPVDEPPDRKKLPIPEGGKPGPESPSSLRPDTLS